MWHEYKCSFSSLCPSFEIPQFFFLKYLSIWLCRVFVAAPGIFVAACGIFFSCGMCEESRSLTKDRTRGPCIGSEAS